MPNSIYIYRLYDMANEILLSQAEKLLAHSTPVSRLRLTRFSQRGIVFADAPVTVDLAAQEIKLPGYKFTAEVRARIYALGVISIIFRIFLPNNYTFDDMVTLAKALENIDEAPFLQALETASQVIRPAIIGEHPLSFPEDLVIFYFQEWNDWDPVPLLLAEKNSVSAETRRETLANKFAYGEDFTILTWDTAIVYDPTGSPDIPNLLEYANAHLLELRYYDSLLENEIEKLYDAISEANTRRFYRKLGKYRALRRKLLALIADITLVTGKIRNSLRITDDIFYAHVYTSYLKVLRESDWEDSIAQKTTVIQNSYSMLNDEVVTHRAELMEMAILILIALEIVLSLIRSG